MVEGQRRLDGIAPEVGQSVGHLGHGRLVDSFELAAVGNPEYEAAAIRMVAECHQMFGKPVAMLR